VKVRASEGREREREREREKKREREREREGERVYFIVFSNRKNRSFIGTKLDGSYFM